MPSRRRHISLALAACTGMMSSGYAGQQPLLTLKLGLWALTTHPQISGTLPVPDSELQKMTPERRAKFEADMRTAATEAAKPRTLKECMTAEKRARGFDTVGKDSATCPWAVDTNTPVEFEQHRTCFTGEKKESIRVHLKIANSESVTGTVNALMSIGDKTMTMNGTIEGKWLAANCGNIKDVEMQNP